jgi:hypothetical protein
MLSREYMFTLGRNTTDSTAITITLLPFRIGMASKTNVADAVQALEALDVFAIAIKVHAGQGLIKSVINAVQELIKEEADLVKAIMSIQGDEPRYSECVNAVVGKLDILKLAADDDSTEEAIRRILGGITRTMEEADAKSSADGAERAAPPSQFDAFMGAEKPTSHLGKIEWPSSIHVHALAISQALALTATKSETYGRYARIVPVEDFMTLVKGAQLLVSKIANATDAARARAGAAVQQPPYTRGQPVRGQVRNPMAQSA